MVKLNDKCGFTAAGPKPAAVSAVSAEEPKELPEDKPQDRPEDKPEEKPEEEPEEGEIRMQRPPVHQESDEDESEDDGAAAKQPETYYKSIRGA